MAGNAGNKGLLVAAVLIGAVGLLIFSSRKKDMAGTVEDVQPRDSIWLRDTKTGADLASYYVSAITPSVAWEESLYAPVFQPSYQQQRTTMERLKARIAELTVATRGRGVESVTVTVAKPVPGPTVPPLPAA